MGTLLTDEGSEWQVFGQEQIARKILCGTMRKYELGLDIPGEELPLSTFLTETTIYFTELILEEALIHTMDPFEDEVIAGGILCCVIANGLGRLFQQPFDETAKNAFHGIYAYAFRDDPEEKDIAWHVTKIFFNNLLERTPILIDIDKKIFAFYEKPCDKTLTAVKISIEALRESIEKK